MSFSFQIRTELEMQMVCNLREFKEFIDNEMIVILGQMDSPTQIFEHVFLVSFRVALGNMLKLVCIDSWGFKAVLNIIIFKENVTYILNKGNKY